MVLHAILGLRPSFAEGKLYIVNPRLPYWLNDVELQQMALGEGAIDLRFQRSGETTKVTVQRNTSGLEVAETDSWPG